MPRVYRENFPLVDQCRNFKWSEPSACELSVGGGGGGRHGGFAACDYDDFDDDDDDDDHLVGSPVSSH